MSFGNCLRSCLICRVAGVICAWRLWATVMANSPAHGQILGMWSLWRLLTFTLHMLASSVLPLLSEDVQRAQVPVVSMILRHPITSQPQQCSFVVWLGQFSQETRLQLSSLGGTGAFTSVHKSLQQEEYRWSLLAGSFGGLELLSDIFQSVFSNLWMAFPEAYQFGKASIIANAQMKPVQDLAFTQVWRGRCCFGGSFFRNKVCLLRMNEATTAAIHSPQMI